MRTGTFLGEVVKMGVLQKKTGKKYDFSRHGRKRGQEKKKKTQKLLREGLGGGVSVHHRHSPSLHPPLPPLPFSCGSQKKKKRGVLEDGRTKNQSRAKQITPPP